MLIPKANGSNPKMVVIAVSNTGLKRVLPASTTQSTRRLGVSLSVASSPSSRRFRVSGEVDIIDQYNGIIHHNSCQRNNSNHSHKYHEIHSKNEESKQDPDQTKKYRN